jgi:hypothetical protein
MGQKIHKGEVHAQKMDGHKKIKQPKDLASVASAEFPAQLRAALLFLGSPSGSRFPDS